MVAFSEYAVLHWDGKMLRDALGGDPGTMLETLAVLVSGPLAYPESKLLGVPMIDSTTGTAQAEASMDLLKVWGLSAVITALVLMLQKIMRSKISPGADYREVTELTLIIFGSTPPRGVHWSHCGAIHQARWMTRNLYSMKMFMFAEQLDTHVDVIYTYCRCPCK